MVGFTGYAMASRGPHTYALRAKLPALNTENKSWVNVARVGQWEGHESGAFQLTRDTFTNFVRNFDKQANPLHVSYEHDHTPGMPRPAAGWITDLELRDNGDSLWALVEWTDRGADAVRGGEYLYCSIVFNEKSTSRETGEDVGPELYELGITNTPFIDGLEAMRLTRFSLSTKDKTMSEAELLALGLKELGDKATFDSLRAWAEGERMKQEAIGGKADKPKDEESAPAELSADTGDAVKLADDMPGEEAPAEEADASEAAALGMLEALASEVGTDLPGLLALMDEQRAALVAALQGSPEDGGAAENIANSRNVALSRRLGDLEAKNIELSNRLVESELDRAIEAGDLVITSTREDLLKDAQDLGIDRLKKLARTLGATVPTGPAVRPKSRVETEGEVVALSSLSAEQQSVARLLMAGGRTEQQSIKRVLESKGEN